MTSDVLAAVASLFVVGDVISSPTMTIDAEMVDSFNRGTWLDIAYPEPDPDEYGSDVVPGFMTLSLLDALGVRASTDAGLVRPTSFYSLNYGLGRVRFVRMVHEGEAVSADFVVRSVAQRVNGVLVTRDCTLYVEPEHDVALVAEWISLHLPTDVPTSGGPPAES